MKRDIFLFLAGALLLSACADLGFGVDYDSVGPYANPYWYGNGYVGDVYWNTPVWNYGPPYRPVPPRPPFVDTNPGPAIPQRPQRPQRPESGFPGINGISRPGNNGFPTPGQGTSKPAAPQIPQKEALDNNARR